MSRAEVANLKFVRVVAVVSSLLLSATVCADSLDAAVMEDAFLQKFSEALSAHDIDVTSNLNNREVISQRIQRPRLGRFPDIPTDSFPDSAEIAAWEEEFLESAIGGLVIIANEDAQQFETNEDFFARWLNSGKQQRLFISFYSSDLSAAQKLEAVANGYGFATQFYYENGSAADAGALYATAAQRLAIDSRAARRYRTEVTELEYLGKRVRRNSNSLFLANGNKGDGSLARREPSVFLKETLGDEFNQSTIEAIIVPGGVALGETASIDISVLELVYRDGELRLIDEVRGLWLLPEITPIDLKALYDFVMRSEAIKSDAIVDIDADGRVRMSSALRDTDAGFVIMHADTQPFEFVPNLSVTKSVVIDTAVNWRKAPSLDKLQFRTDFEVRFLSADIMRIAQTRVALGYRYHSESRNMSYLDGWGRDLHRLDENLDYSGLGSSMEEVADYAAWVGLFRRLQEDKVTFLQGRYEFMKIDKTGRDTPARY